MGTVADRVQLFDFEVCRIVVSIVLCFAYGNNLVKYRPAYYRI